MKRILFTCLWISLALGSTAQNRLDSLCKGPIDAWQWRTLTPGWHSLDYVVMPNWDYETDSTKSLNVVYVGRKVDSYGDRPLDGWFETSWHTRHVCSPILFEVGLSHINSLMGDVYRRSEQRRNGSVCFNEGVPCCTWHYVSFKRPKEGESAPVDSMYRTIHFDDGLLHGDYVVYNNKRDTIYRTTFHHGTGHYKDFYANGKVIWEGDLVEGYRDGLWHYYYYDWDQDIYTDVVVEDYRNGELRHETRFVNNRLIEKGARREESKRSKKRMSSASAAKM